MNVEKSDRGFDHLLHPKYLPPHDAARVASVSSAIGDYPDSWDRPGSSFLWVGDHHHLGREEVAALVAHLQAWLATGRLSLPPE
jgi:hypothetical protein